mgnify:FL=1
MNLVLVRHGQSEWNALNLFTGWKDPGLTDQGRQEANQAGQLIQSLNLDFDVMFTSALVRAQLTGDIILNIIKQTHIPTIKNQALNERNNGDLAGLNKDDARAKWGAEQVQIWRRSYDTPPPGGESLKDTGERVMPYFNQEILPLIKKGQNILISAHGNSLRSMIKFLDYISDTEIVKLEIPTGAPIHFTFNKNGDVDSRTDLF